jgi:hypothetical protein
MGQIRDTIKPYTDKVPWIKRRLYFLDGFLNQIKASFSNSKHTSADLLDLIAEIARVFGKEQAKECGGMVSEIRGCDLTSSCQNSVKRGASVSPLGAPSTKP